MSGYSTYAAIIFVTETERRAVERMFDWSDLRMAGDAQTYAEAFVERDGRRLRVVCAQQDEMGMTASATLTMKMIQHFAPEYVIMPGIAAGTGNASASSRQEFGDVLLASSVWNFSSPILTKRPSSSVPTSSISPMYSSYTTTTFFRLSFSSS